MSEAGIVDFAALDAETGAEVDASALDTEVDTGVDTEVETGSEHTEEVTEGSEDAEHGADRKTEQSQVKDSGPVAPKLISEALKALKADPTNAGAAKVLRDAYFGEQAFKKEFPSVQAARDTKTFLSEVAGADGQPVTLEQAREAYASTRAVLQNIEETDELVRAGDGSIWDNIIADLKDENKLDSVPKLVASGLDKLRDLDVNGYYSTVKPHMLSGLQEAQFPQALNAVYAALNAGDTAKAKAILKGTADWFTGLKTEVDKAKAEQSDSAKLSTERQKWETEKAQAESKTFRESTALEADKYSNTALGSHLKTYLKMPFFKGFPRGTLIDLGNGIKANLYSALENDKAYQTQMKAMWGQKSPDKTKITAFHKATLDRIAKEVVDKTVNQRYPGYAKGGSAAGRIAASKEKQAASARASATSVATSKPIYVATKPKDLVRNPVVVGGKEYGTNDLQLMEIGGRGFTKGTDGKFRLVTWRR